MPTPDLDNLSPFPVPAGGVAPANLPPELLGDLPAGDRQRVRPPPGEDYYAEIIASRNLEAKAGACFLRALLIDQMAKAAIDAARAHIPGGNGVSGLARKQATAHLGALADVYSKFADSSLDLLT